LRVAASLVGQVAQQLQLKLKARLFSSRWVDAKWVSECAKDLVANRGKAFVVAGQRQPMEIHMIANAINAELFALGEKIEAVPTIKVVGASFDQLSKSFDNGTVDTLVILGGNPAYNLNLSSKIKRLSGWVITKTKRRKKLIGTSISALS